MTDSQSEPVPRPAATKAAPVRLQTVVYSMALALMIGWILHIGASVLVPMVLALMLSYVVAGVSRLIGTVPVVGKLVPPGLRYLASALLIGYVAVQMVILFTTNMLAFAVREFGLPPGLNFSTSSARSCGTQLGSDRFSR